MTPGRPRANFKILRQTAEFILIQDVGPWDRYPTVTNDAEDVVARLTTGGKLRTGCRLFYGDSQGRIDEILHKDGRFLGFAAGPRAGAAEQITEPGFLPTPGPEDMPPLLGRP